MKLRFFDKFVIFLLCAILFFRAPFIMVPLGLIIYMGYALTRSFKEKIKRQKRKAMKKHLKKLQAERVEQTPEVPASG